MSAIAITSPGDAREMQTKPLAGLVFACRFHPNGSSEERNVERPIADGEGWLWLHFNLADARKRTSAPKSECSTQFRSSQRSPRARLAYQAAAKSRLWRCVYVRLARQELRRTSRKRH